LKRYTEDESCTGLEGCSGIQTFYFEGIQAGEATIKLVYQRWGVEVEEEFEVTVIVN